MRDVSQRLERGAGRFLVPQIDREKLNIPAAGQLGLAAGDADHIPARGKKFFDRGDTQQAACTRDEYLVCLGRAHRFSSSLLARVARQR